MVGAVDHENVFEWFQLGIERNLDNFLRYAESLLLLFGEPQVHLRRLAVAEAYDLLFLPIQSLIPNCYKPSFLVMACLELRIEKSYNFTLCLAFSDDIA